MKTVSPYFGSSSSQYTSNIQPPTMIAEHSRKRSIEESLHAVQNGAVDASHSTSEPFVKGFDDAVHTNGVQTNGLLEHIEVKHEIKTEVKSEVKQKAPVGTGARRKKRDRFNGTSEEEVLKMTLPDRIKPGLDILIIGINPGLTAAYVGHHYAGPGNHFWKCLYESGLIPEPLTAFQDERTLNYGIGLCNIVDRTTRGSNDLSRKEIKDGGEILKEKIKQYKPKIAVFNGKGIYEIFCGNKNFSFGKQPSPFPETDTVVYVMPSSSARCAQLPRAIDKAPFYVALKKLRDHLRGELPDLQESDVCFHHLELKCAKRVKPERTLDEQNEGHAQQAVPAKRARKSAKTSSQNTSSHIKQEPGVTGQVHIDCNGSAHINGEPSVMESGSMPPTSSNNLIVNPSSKRASTTQVNRLLNDSSLLTNPHQSPNLLYAPPVQSNNPNPNLRSAINMTLSTATSTAIHAPSLASSALQYVSNPNIISMHSNVPLSNSQSRVSTGLKRNSAETGDSKWKQANKASGGTVTEATSEAESIAHIPCTSSAILTSEWINKHFNNPPVQPQYQSTSWNTHFEHGIRAQSQWYLGNMNGHGLVKLEPPCDGFGPTVTPSR